MTTTTTMGESPRSNWMGPMPSHGPITVKVPNGRKVNGMVEELESVVEGPVGVWEVRADVALEIRMDGALEMRMDRALER